MALLLIRHGETEFNATRVVQFPDTPLGEHGLKQAERLAQSLASRGVERILTSDYLRAHTTAEMVARHTGAPLVVSEHLRERNFGEIRGTPYDELGDIDIFAENFNPIGGETWAVFHERVDRAWAEVQRHASETGGALAVVTHGLVLRSLFQRRLDCREHLVGDDVIVANTSVTVVDRSPPWRVVEFASTAHLDGGERLVAPV